MQYDKRKAASADTERSRTRNIERKPLEQAV